MERASTFEDLQERARMFARVVLTLHNEPHRGMHMLDDMSDQDISAIMGTNSPAMIAAARKFAKVIVETHHKASCYAHLKLMHKIGLVDIPEMDK
jgi:hypothetical protein